MFEVKILASGSKGNCYALEAGGPPLLLECGIPVRRIREGLDFSLSHAAGCLLTHDHQDHAKSAKEVMAAGVDLYATPGTLEALGIEEGHRAHGVTPRKWFTVGGGWRAQAFPVIHDCKEPCAFLAAWGDERILYMTDTAYSPYRFEGLTGIMIECNYDAEILKKNVKAGLVDRTVMRRVLKNHMSVERVKAFLRATNLSRVRRIVLVHLSDDNSDAERFKREIRALTGKPVRVA